MTRKLPPNDDSPQEAVQSYLDLMLTPNSASEITEPLVNQLPDRVARSKFAKMPPPLTMVGGTAMSSMPTGRRKRHGDAPGFKPFAEPVKPLTLKMPPSTVEPEVAEKTQPIQGQGLKQQRLKEQRLKEQVQTKDKVSEPVSPVVKPQSKTPPLPPVKTPPKTKVMEPQKSVKMPDDTAVGSAPVIEPGTVSVSDELQSEGHYQPSPWLENGRPSWAQGRFECLLFSVAGLTLAVPLVELGTIYSLEEEVTPIFGQADWFLGLLSIKGVNIRTVNTAKVVMPERYKNTMEEQFSYVITINNVDWGLAVDTVSTAITLMPEDVRWRSQRSKRPWLAGTVVEKMCALLDVSQLAAMFVEQDQPRR